MIERIISNVEQAVKVMTGSKLFKENKQKHDALFVAGQQLQQCARDLDALCSRIRQESAEKGRRI